MKKIGILVMLMALMCACVYVPNEEEHFIDEKFALIDKIEKEVVVDGDTRTVRTWKISRLASVGDSLEIGEISDNEDNCGCGILTEELWQTKEVGDILYFEYINKVRFYKVKNHASMNLVGELTDYETVEVVVRPNPLSIIPTEVKATTAIGMNKMEVEREILEKERQLMTLEREIETLKESIK